MAIVITKEGPNEKAYVNSGFVSTRAEINDIPSYYAEGSVFIVVEDLSVWVKIDGVMTELQEGGIV